MERLLQGRKEWLSERSEVIDSTIFPSVHMPYYRPSRSLGMHTACQLSYALITVSIVMFFTEQVSDVLGRTADKVPSQFEFSELVIAKLPSMWRQFGFCLEITKSELDAIQDCGGRPSDHFTDVFSLWKQTERRPFSWQTVVEVLESYTIGEKRLAQYIKQLKL